MLVLSPRTLRASLAFLGFSIVAGAAMAQPMPGAMGFGGPAGPTEVGVITLHKESITVTTELSGRVKASQTADVRPRVGGIVKAINFQPGHEVKAGDILFELEDASLQAELAVQEAYLQKAKSSESSAQAKVDRYQQLAGNNNVSKSDILDAQASLAQAKADVASAQANLEVAQLNLSYAKVAAPISGIISESSVSQGALVTAAQTNALATIRQIDPIYVDLVDSSANLVNLREQFTNSADQSGTQTDAPRDSVELILENGKRYDHTGSLTSTDVVVSESTGTFTIRSSFANPERLLLPGMFVRADVSLGFKLEGFLVPQLAVTFDATGKASVLVAENGKVATRQLTIGGNSGPNWIATSGLEDGAQVIVDGLQKVQVGADIKPVEVTLDKNGVVVQPAIPAGAPAGEAGTPPASADGMPAPPSGADASGAQAAPAGATPSKGE